jgi:hypothetical protein
MLPIPNHLALMGLCQDTRSQRIQTSLSQSQHVSPNRHSSLSKAYRRLTNQLRCNAGLQNYGTEQAYQQAQ